MVRVLAAVSNPAPTQDLPIFGRDIRVDLPDAVDPVSIGKFDLPWLFAMEGIDAAWIRAYGSGTEVLVARHDLYDLLLEKGTAGLVHAAKDLGRPVIAKILPGPPPPDGKEWLLHPVQLDDGSTVWRNTSYLVGLPPGVRRAELLLNATTPLQLPQRPTDLFILISEPPVEGLEQRLASGIQAVETMSRITVSLASWTESGQRHLRAFSSEQRPVHDFGSMLHPRCWEIAVRSLVHCTRPDTLWAIGNGRTLEPFANWAREIIPGLRIVGEAVDSDSIPTPADTTIVRTEAQRSRLEGTPGIGALHVAKTPIAHRPTKPTPKVRRILGVPADATLVVVAGDLTAPGRAEDAAVVAHRLSSREDVWFRVVGRGPLAPAVADLGRLFGLKRFAVNDIDHSLDEIVAAADVVCCPGRNEVLPPSAAAAVASGIPVVAPSSGEAAELADSGVDGIHLGGAAGDTEKLADALIEAIETGSPSSGIPEKEAATRSEQTKRIYREALTGQET